MIDNKEDFSKYKVVKRIYTSKFSRIILISDKISGELKVMKTILLALKDGMSQKVFLNKLYELRLSKFPTLLPYQTFSLTDFIFENNLCPSIFFQYYKNGSLYDCCKSLTNTQKMIVLIGIVEGMRYLHFNNLYHGCLEPGNIILDDDFHPLICSYGLTDLAETFKIDAFRSIFSFPSIIATSESDLPKTEDEKELFLKQADDVFSFSMLLYFVLTNETPLQKQCRTCQERTERFIKGFRPQLPSWVPCELAKLEFECWQADATKRPTFREISNRLKSCTSILPPGIDISEVRNYMNSLSDPEERIELKESIDQEKSANRQENDKKIIESNQSKSDDSNQSERKSANSSVEIENENQNESNEIKDESEKNNLKGKKIPISRFQNQRIPISRNNSFMQNKILSNSSSKGSQDSLSEAHSASSISQQEQKNTNSAPSSPSSRKSNEETSLQSSIENSPLPRPNIEMPAHSSMENSPLPKTQFEKISLQSSTENSPLFKANNEETSKLDNLQKSQETTWLNNENTNSSDLSLSSEYEIPINKLENPPSPQVRKEIRNKFSSESESFSESDSDLKIETDKSDSDFKNEDGAQNLSRKDFEALKAQTKEGKQKILNGEIEEGAFLIKSAAKSSYRGAVFAFGRLCECGVGINQNLKMAAEQYRRASSMGSNNAKAAYARFAKKGLGDVQHNLSASINLLKLAANSQLQKWAKKPNLTFEKRKIPKKSMDDMHNLFPPKTEAMYKYGKYLKKKFREENNYDILEQALKYAQPAAEKDFNIPAMNLYGEIILELGLKNKYKKAAECFKIAANEGYSEAQYNYGFCLMEAFGVTKNCVKAVEYFKLSADQKNPRALNEYGNALQEGIGIEQDVMEAKKYIKMAADLGNSDAQYNYALLLQVGIGFDSDNPREKELADLEIYDYLRKASDNDYPEAIIMFSQITLRDLNKVNPADRNGRLKSCKFYLKRLIQISQDDEKREQANDLLENVILKLKS